MRKGHNTMKKILAATAAVWMCAFAATFAAYPTASKSITIDANVDYDAFTAFRWTVLGYNDYTLSWQIDNAGDISSYYAVFKANKDVAGVSSNFILKGTADCTTSTNTIGTTLSHTNIPPNGT